MENGASEKDHQGTKFLKFFLVLISQFIYFIVKLYYFTYLISMLCHWGVHCIPWECVCVSQTKSLSNFVLKKLGYMCK